MKQKRPSPLDEPPTASSSDSEEDQQPSSQQHQEEEEEEASSEEVSSEEEEDDDEEEKPPSKTPPPPPTPKPASSDSETDSDSDSDSEQPATNPKVKPIASKPIEQTPKAKPQPPASATTRSSSKRPAENNGHVTDPKRAKKKGADAAAAGSDDEAEEDGKKSGDESKKLFQRLWSEEDEIAILKGIVEFTSKTGSDPLKYANAFHDFMKKSLHVEASSNQLKQKIRRLKKKFETNAGKGKNGEGPSFSKPHDQKAFELSKKVWGNAGAEEKPKSNGKAAKSPKKEGSSRNVAPPKPKPKSEPKSELASMVSKEAGKMDNDEKTDTTSYLMEVIRVDKGVGLYGLSEDMIKRGVELIGASKRAELEVQWKELQVAELELHLKRAELVANQARLILEAYKSSYN